MCLDDRECLFWDMFMNSVLVLTAFLIIYCSLFIFSVAISCYLLYLALRHRYPRKPQYLLMANLAVCNILLTITPVVFLLPRVVHRETVILSKWCISFLPIFGNFLIACRLTWVFLAFHRYIFICHAIHYTRIFRMLSGRGTRSCVTRGRFTKSTS